MRSFRAIVGLATVLALSSCSGRPPGTAPGGVFYPPPPATPRLQYLTHYSSSADVQKRRGAFSRLVFGKDELVDEVEKPYGVAIYEGAIYVCDTKRNVLMIFDFKNGEFGYLGFQGRGQLLKPINMFIDKEGAKFVADAERKEIVIFDATDTFVRAIGGGQLERPVDVVVSGGKIYVCDAKTSEIVVFDRFSYAYEYRFGGKGTEEGKFARPTNIAADEEGNIYISDTINGRIQKCDPAGRPLRTFGRLGDGLGEFARPKGVAVDREGRLYVADAAFENVQIFDADGRLLLFFSEAGNEPGQLNLPAQVALDYENVAYFRKYASKDFEIEYLVLVTSQYGPRKVNVYGFGNPRSAP